MVATEIRKLAERSQGAAKEISSVAASSVKVAERSGELLSDLVPSIRKTADLVQEVAAASEEQASGVNQINSAMSRVDQVAQRNASAADELSSTAQELSAQSQVLARRMSFFQLDAAVSATLPEVDVVGEASGEARAGGNGRHGRRLPDVRLPLPVVAPAAVSAVDDDRDFERF